MSQISLNLPSQAKVIGSLWDTSNIDYLDEDMLSVELPGGFHILVGWFPELDVNGEYQLFTFTGEFTNPRNVRLRTTSVYEIEAEVHRLVKLHLAPTVFLGSGSTTISVLANGQVISPNPQNIVPVSTSTTRAPLLERYVA
jgi:hypothetical protein